MSGTSLDGIDAALVSFGEGASKLLHCHFHPFDESLRTELLDLNRTGPNELERAGLAANQLSRHYASAIQELLKPSGIEPRQISGIGCHGQTIRHRPDLGFTIQLANPSLLAELTGITVVADFRSRDIAAGGHGAPLVPAFHASLFRHPRQHRVIVNIGGISNLTDLPPRGKVIGFDCGPGNLLLDGWISQHLNQAYDKNGTWAASGHVLTELLQRLLAEPFFAEPPPRSTGRDLFNLSWLENHLSAEFAPADVQSTLLQLTVEGIAKSVLDYCSEGREIYLCGGGAHNGELVRRLKLRLPDRSIASTKEIGVEPDWVEAFAFAWLARQTLHHLSGNLPEVTGARGPRILGGIYQA